MNNKKIVIVLGFAGSFAFAAGPTGGATAGAVTADQQSMDSNDMGLTRRIRKNLSAQEKLSTYGKNVKIITSSGKVVLRGPVRSAEEKRMIEESAVSVAGAGNVTNQLEIVTK